MKTVYFRPATNYFLEKCTRGKLHLNVHLIKKGEMATIEDKEILNLESYKSLKEILSDLKPNNITSIQGNRQSGIEDYNLVISNLIKQKDKLILLKEKGFTTTNLSSILSGSGFKSAKAIAELGENAVKLIQLKKKGFTARNLSSILSKSGTKLGVAIVAFERNVDKLEPLKENGFSANNLSYILSASGAKLEEVIVTLEKNAAKLILLKENGFTPESLPYMISKSHKKANKAIERSLL